MEEVSPYRELYPPANIDEFFPLSVLKHPAPIN
jgi:hypothetical protein